MKKTLQALLILLLLAGCAKTPAATPPAETPSPVISSPTVSSPPTQPISPTTAAPSRILLAIPTPEPTQPPSTQPAAAGPLILYVTPTTCIVKAVSPSGGEPIPLTTTPLPEGCLRPQFSPDGKKLALLLDSNDGPYLYVMNLDGSNLTPIAHTMAFDWSPDSTQLAYATRNAETQNGEIFVSNADGSAAHAIGYTDVSICTGCDTDHSLAWSPDGQWIYSPADPGYPENGEPTHHIFKVDGSEYHQLSERPVNIFVGPVWSPDSRWLAQVFREPEGYGCGQIEILGIDGSRQIVSGEHARQADSLEERTICFFSASLQWSPDGQSILAAGKSPLNEAGMSASYDTATWALSTHGNVQILGDCPYSLGTSLRSPDGSLQVFVSIESGDAYVASGPLVSMKNDPAFPDYRVLDEAAISWRGSLYWQAGSGTGEPSAETAPEKGEVPLASGTLPTPEALTDLQAITPASAARVANVASLEAVSTHFLVLSPDWQFLVSTDGASQVTVWDGSALANGSFQLTSVASLSLDPYEVRSAHLDMTLQTALFELCLPGSDQCRLAAYLLAPPDLYPLDMGGTPVEFLLPAPLAENSLSAAEWMYAAVTAGQVGLFSLGNGSPVGQLDGEATTALFSPGGSLLAVGNSQGEITLWNTGGEEINAWQKASPLPGQGSPVVALAFSPEGNSLAAGLSSGEASLWDLASGQEVLRFSHPSPLSALAFSPDGRILAAGYEDGSILLWDAQSGAQRMALNASEKVTRLFFSPDGHWLLSVIPAAAPQLWGVSP